MLNTIGAKHEIDLGGVLFSGCHGGRQVLVHSYFRKITYFMYTEYNVFIKVLLVLSRRSRGPYKNF